MSIQNALTRNLPFGDGIERVWTSFTHGDRHELETKLCGIVSVDHLDEEVVDKLQTKIGGDLATGVPSIALTLDGKQFNLNWQEAYNLAEMLTRATNLALYG